MQYLQLKNEGAVNGETEQISAKQAQVWPRSASHRFEISVASDTA